MRIERFKNFKNKKKQKIKRIEDFAYSWVPSYNTSSPAPGTSVAIKKIEIG